MYEIGKAQAGQLASAIGSGLLAQQAQYVNPAPPAPPTLLSAISRSDELIKRLASLHSDITQIATQIGGPWPADAEGGKPTSASQPPAMVVLNESVNEAHVWVSRIEQSIGAIRRSLGG